MKKEEQVTYPVPMYAISSVILTLRGQRVILDADMARIYGVATKVLNQAVKRNAGRFPPDFMFQLSLLETANLKSQSVTSSLQPVVSKADKVNWSQIVTSSDVDIRSRSQFVTLKRGQNIKYLPYAFTEHGAIMAATVLNSQRAVQMSVFVVRAFIKMREQLLERTGMEKRLAEIEKGLLSHDTALRDLYAKIRPLLLPPPDPPKKSIGFHVKERRAHYGARS